jgi:hypothetical protein
MRNFSYGNEVATGRDWRDRVAQDDGMAQGWSRTGASVLATTCLLMCGCSSSAKPAARTPSSTGSVADSVGAVQAYLDAVNRLCDALLPEVMALPNGGNLDVPVAQYLAQLPAHTKLLSDFDQDLAKVPVPPQATDKAAAFNAYVTFANQLDAKRQAAARQGQAAYAKEIQSEQASAANDPSIAARTAAGFHDSCDAR